jgi:hypothetical protein
MIGLVPAALVGPQGIVSHLATLAVAVLTVVAVDRPVERWRQARVRRTTERNRPEIPVPLEIRVQASA